MIPNEYRISQCTLQHAHLEDSSNDCTRKMHRLADGKRDGYDGDFNLSIVLLIRMYCLDGFPGQLDSLTV